ncbi:MAG: DUF1987 domain-containing protein [Bacteroidales bacterium]|nr:DUF1987 domain-containing protein [Bacteroidales bacterium]
MDILEHTSSAKTPYVLLDPAGIIKFRGRSIPEDVALVYDPVIEWINEYIKKPSAETEVDVAMEYLNSGSSKYMLRILKAIKQIDLMGLPLKINWYYEEGDDDILERGEYYASILDLDINLVETE